MEIQERGVSASGGTPQQAQARSEFYETIGELAREFNVTLRTLRFYEDRGLLHPLRKGSARLYSRRDRLHLQMILKGRRLGFTLTEIHDILADCGEAAQANEPSLPLRPAQISAQIRHLERQRVALEAALSELRRAQERLRGTTMA